MPKIKDSPPKAARLEVATVKLPGSARRGRAAARELQNCATALDAASEGIAITGPDGCYTYINPAHLSLFGYREPAEVLGKSWHIFYTQEEIGFIESSVFPELLEKKIWRGRVRGHRKDRSSFIQELSLSLLPDGGIACICSDATERIEGIEQRERLFSVSKSLLVICDFEGNIRQFNPAWTDLLGYTREEFLSRPILSHVCPEDQAATIEAMDGLRRGIPVVNFTNRFFASDGRILTLDWSSNSSAEQGLVFASAHNITKRRVVEQSLKESEDNFRTFFETLDDMIFVGNPGGQILFSNRAASRKLGYTPEELRTMLLIDLHPAEMRQKAEEIVGAMLRGERETCPLPLEKQSGGRLLVETRVWLGKWDGKDCLFGLCKDITAEQEAKHGREELLDRFLKIAGRVPGLIYQYRLRPDGTSCFPFASDAIRDIYRVTPQEVSEDASKVFANIHTEDADAVRASILKSAQDLTPWQHEYRVGFSDGTIRTLYGNSVPQREPDGSVLWHGFITDITERKRAEGVVLQGVARAEELARLKSRLVSMASHELRTPLANIMVACELLKNFSHTMPAERSQLVLSGLVNGVSSMVHTLDDLLLAGKIEEGKLPYTPARFALLDFLKRCCQEVQPDLTLPSRIGIGFRDAGLRVNADERLLHHILKNLLGNALKYSPEDTRVELGVEAGPDSLTLSVLDRGIGVPEADRKFLFDAFSRASNVGDSPGSGLGLFIAEKCAQAHGGRMRYAPQPDGSVFSVTIPLSATTDIDPNT